MRTLAVAMLPVLVIAAVSAQNVSGREGAVAAERPLNLPNLQPDQPCPVSIGSANTVPRERYIFGGPWWFGEGPVYVDFPWGHGEQARFSLTSVPTERSGLRRAKTAWVADVSFSGSVLIRGWSLRADGKALLFKTGGGTPAERLQLQAPHGPFTGVWSFWPSSMFMPGAGCYGIQIDTLRDTHVVVFETS